MARKRIFYWRYYLMDISITLIKVIEMSLFDYEKKYHAFNLTRDYRPLMSFNSFFHSMNRYNHTRNRLFISVRPDEGRYYNEIKVPENQILSSIYQFFYIIKYDYKKKRYFNGEKIFKQ